MQNSLKTKKILSIFISIVITLAPFDFIKADEAKEEVVSYIKDMSSVMSNVDITIRNIGFNYLPMTEGLRRINTYITQASLLKHPEEFSRQHKMIILSFRKLRMGLLLFSAEKREISVRLIRNGNRLLKSAANDIIDIAKREGIINKKEEKNKSEIQE